MESFENRGSVFLPGGLRPPRGPAGTHGTGLFDLCNLRHLWTIALWNYFSSTAHPTPIFNCGTKLPPPTRKSAKKPLVC